MAANVQDLWSILSKNEQSHRSSELKPTLNGQQISPDTSNITISTQVAPIWVKSREEDAKQGVWFCLATYNVRLTLPAGFDATGSDAGSKVSLGIIRVQVSHDQTAQPLSRDGKEVLVVSCEHAGPTASERSESVSNSVSQDVGVNIGAFGDVPTVGASYSRSLSNSITKDIRDVQIRTNMDDHTRTVWWTFDFTGLPDSPAAGSTFDYTVQAIWRYQPLITEDLTKMAFEVKVDWQPHAYWIASGRHISEGLGETQEASSNFALNNALHEFDIPASVVGVKKKPSA